MSTLVSPLLIAITMIGLTVALAAVGGLYLAERARRQYYQHRYEIETQNTATLRDAFHDGRKLWLREEERHAVTKRDLRECQMREQLAISRRKA